MSGAQRGRCLLVPTPPIRALARYPRKNQGTGRQGRSILFYRRLALGHLPDPRPETGTLTPPSPGGTEEALVMASGPADTLETCGLMFVQVINMAKERIWIASPYFVPDLQVLSALKLAVLRGVDVRNSSSRKTGSSYRPPGVLFLCIRTPCRQGSTSYRYNGRLFCTRKCFWWTSQCAAVGTANLDNRSFRLNFELTLLNYDRALSFGAVADKCSTKISTTARPCKTGRLYRTPSFCSNSRCGPARLLAPVLCCFP